MTVLAAHNLTLFSHGTVAAGRTRPAARLANWLKRLTHQARQPANQARIRRGFRRFNGAVLGGIMGMGAGIGTASWSALASGSIGIAIPGLATAAFVGFPIGAAAGLLVVMGAEKLSRMASRKPAVPVGGVTRQTKHIQTAALPRL